MIPAPLLVADSRSTAPRPRPLSGLHRAASPKSRQVIQAKHPIVIPKSRGKAANFKLQKAVNSTASAGQQQKGSHSARNDPLDAGLPLHVSTGELKLPAWSKSDPPPLETSAVVSLAWSGAPKRHPVLLHRSATLETQLGNPDSPHPCLCIRLCAAAALEHGGCKVPQSGCAVVTHPCCSTEDEAPLPRARGCSHLVTGSISPPGVTNVAKCWMQETQAADGSPQKPAPAQQQQPCSHLPPHTVPSRCLLC